MPFVASFSASQVAGSPSEIVLTDTSTGSDAAITQRRVYLQKMDGSYLVPSGTLTSYIAWSYALGTITIDALDKDYALLVTVQFLDVNDAILYFSQQYYGFTLYNSTFDYSTTQLLAGNPMLINDNNFWQNKILLRTLITEGNDALLLASDQTLAQLCYNAATDLRLNSQYFFNANA